MERTKKNKKIMLAAAACCLAFLLAGCKSQADFYVDQKSPEREAEDRPPEAFAKEGASDGTAKEAPPKEVMSESTAEEDIYVQVCGAVKTPGVYKLPVGSRIFEAVDMAGGITEEAELVSVNQAEVLTDGQMVYICAKGEQQLPEGQPERGNPQDDRVDLNTASAEQLMTLPGVGQSKADSIISWREKHGAFGSIEDIMNIEGIKEGVFSKLKDHIKVD